MDFDIECIGLRDLPHAALRTDTLNSLDSYSP